MQAVEVRTAVNAEQHGLAVNDKGAVAVEQRGFRIAFAPVVSVAGEEPRALAVALDGHLLPLIVPV